MDVFISIPFASAFTEVSRVVSEVASTRGLAAYRVDQDHLGKPIAQAIDRKIRESRIVVADITGSNPNVLHELGQAQSLGKPLVIISQDDLQTAPFNVRSLRIHRYDPRKLADLRRILKLALSEATSPNEKLRAMLVPASLGLPTKESRFVIVASPLSFRRAMGRSSGYKKLRRTYSDYVGIRGILQAFGLLYGFDALPELIDPKDYDNAAMAERMNIYCIASPKANHWTAALLQLYHQNFVPRIEYRADSASPDLANVKVSIYSDDALLTPSGWRINVDNDRKGRDFGLIIRGPNPRHHDRMVAIMAGRSSLGTEAACRAFTDVDVITKIRDQLVGMQIDMENHEQGFWALVSIESAIGDGKEEAIPESLRVHRVDKFHRI